MARLFIEVSVMSKSVSYQNYLIQSLADPEEAAGYLTAALEGGDLKVFLLALRNVIESSGGVSQLAQSTNKSRTSLYKTLSADGNPYLKNTNEILHALGLQIAITKLENTNRRAA